MAMVILFRDISSYSPFKDALYDLVSAPGDELILSSGYIWPYLVNKDFILHLDKHMKNGKIRLIAGNFDNSSNHKTKFDQTYNDLATEINKLNKTGANIDLRPQIHVYTHNNKKNLWHSKIALKVQSAANEVTAALVGSSNLSWNSLGEPVGRTVTHECDVYIWEGRKFKSIFRNIHTYYNDSKTLDQRNAISEMLNLSTVIPANTAMPQKVLFDHLLNKVSSFRI